IERSNGPKYDSRGWSEFARAGLGWVTPGIFLFAACPPPSGRRRKGREFFGIGYPGCRSRTRFALGNYLAAPLGLSWNSLRSQGLTNKAQRPGPRKPGIAAKRH